MSSLSATVCLYTAALCNVAVLDQSLFGPQQGGQQQQYNGQNLLGTATNLFNVGLGALTGTGGRPQGQGNNRPRSPHQSPCPGKFQYVTNGREWKGIIKLKNVNPNADTRLEVEFLLPQGLQRRNYQARIDLVNGDTAYDDVANGLPLLFEVIFNSQNPVPKLVAIYKNRKEICSGPLDSYEGLQTFRTNYVLPASGGGGGALDGETEDRFSLSSVPVQPQPQQQQQQVQQQVQRPANNQNVNQFQDDNTVCGAPVAGFTQSLVIGGAAAGRGEWPWLVAFYRSANGNLEFICGGSLISSTFTLTAAHCIQDKGRDTPMQTQNALLFIGKHNLIQWNEEGYEKRGAELFKVHPDWNPNDNKYDADIALIKMEQAVRYSKYIRPICLWNGPEDINSVVGQVGIVAGWGKNDDGKLNTDFPKKVNVPIVSDGQCLRTNEAFVHITSDRTFCAGGRAGEGPCQGDSGGGLVLKSGKKWYIRGIVSASLRDGASCDVNSYAVFTDIAKFMPWIRTETS